MIILNEVKTSFHLLPLLDAAFSIIAKLSAVAITGCSSVHLTTSSLNLIVYFYALQKFR